MENAPLAPEKKSEDDDDKEESPGLDLIALVEQVRKKDKAKEKEPEEKPVKKEKAPEPEDTKTEEVTPAEEEPVAAEETETVELDEAGADIADVEVLSQDEQAFALQQAAEERLANLDPKTMEDAAAQHLLEGVAKDGDMEAAQAETVELLGGDEKDLAELNAPIETPAETPPETAPEAETETQAEDEPEVVEAGTELVEPEAEIVDGEVVDEEPPEPEAPRSFDDDEEVVDLSPEDVIEEPVTAAGTPPPPPGAGPGFNAVPDGPAAAGPNVNAVPVGVMNNRERTPSNTAASTLLGAMAGYFVGRRHGRIKAEKELIPIQKKLEKQVGDLNWQLQEKEDRIRKIAARKARQSEAGGFGSVMAASLAEKTAMRQAEKKMAAAPLPVGGERIKEQRRKAPEARVLHMPDKAQEKIGHVLVAAEASRLRRNENPETTTLKSAAEKTSHIEAGHLANKRVETLNRAELLSLSEKIIIDGTSLRQIYETNLVGEQGLRRLINEHLRGGDVKKMLRHEIVEHEIDFERDPVLRGIAPVSTVTGGGKAALNQMLEKATADLGHDENTVFYKTQADYEAQHREQQQKQRHAIDTAFVTIILLLIGLVVLLAITRG